MIIDSSCPQNRSVMILNQCLGLVLILNLGFQGVLGLSDFEPYPVLDHDCDDPVYRDEWKVWCNYAPIHVGPENCRENHYWDWYWDFCMSSDYLCDPDTVDDTYDYNYDEVAPECHERGFILEPDLNTDCHYENYRNDIANKVWCMYGPIHDGVENCGDNHYWDWYWDWCQDEGYTCDPNPFVDVYDYNYAPDIPEEYEECISTSTSTSTSTRTTTSTSTSTTTISTTHFDDSDLEEGKAPFPPILILLTIELQNC